MSQVTPDHDKMRKLQSKRDKHKQKKNTKRTQIKRGLELGLQSMQIPHNEQLALTTMVDAMKTKHKMRYAACLAGPEYTMSRVPDSFPRATALVRSKQVIQVPVFLDTTIDSGRFALNFNPSLGSLSNPSTYKTALVKSSSGWPFYLTQPSSFLSTNNGRDIRLDPFISQLTQPDPGVVTYSNASGTGQAAANPFGSAVVVSDGGNLTADYIPGQPSGSLFLPPPGQYRYTIAFTLPVAGGNNTTPTIVGVGGAIVTFDFSEISADLGTSTTAGYLYIPPPDETTGVNGGIGVKIGGVVALPLAARINLVTAFDSSKSLLGTYNYGPTSCYRTVAMAALATYTGPELTNGGNIAAAYLPANFSKTQFFWQFIRHR